jgi:hypothetical protein
MFYANKYVLFYRASRPKPSSDIINSSLSRILNLSLIVYGLGSLTWTSFVPTDEPKYAIVPNLICVGLGVLLQLVPLELIIKCVQKSEENRAMVYD